jgi:hypothetical protein
MTKNSFRVLEMSLGWEKGTGELEKNFVLIKSLLRNLRKILK